MPRKGPAKKREILPDPVYGNQLLTRLINRVMLDGKKSVAEKIVYGALKICEEKTGNSGVEIFQQAMENVMPTVEVRPRRIGGATFQVPQDVRPDRKISLALRWIVTNSRKKGSYKTMMEKLASELMDAANNTGASVKKREDTFKMAEANKAFAHYRY